MIILREAVIWVKASIGFFLVFSGSIDGSNSRNFTRSSSMEKRITFGRRTIFAGAKFSWVVQNVYRLLPSVWTCLHVICKIWATLIVSLPKRISSSLPETPAHKKQCFSAFSKQHGNIFHVNSEECRILSNSVYRLSYYSKYHRFKLNLLAQTHSPCVLSEFWTDWFSALRVVFNTK